MIIHNTTKENSMNDLAEISRNIDAAIATLPEDIASVMHMRYRPAVDTLPLTIAQTAQFRSCTEKRVMWLLKRGIRRLNKTHPGIVEQMRTAKTSGLILAPLPEDLNALFSVSQTATAVLTYREREILKLRYGLCDGYSYTLEETGRIFKVTRERIRQIESKAVKKIVAINADWPTVLNNWSRMCIVINDERLMEKYLHE